MGIEEVIEPGGLFPICASPAEALSLEGLLWDRGNHPSFKATRGDEAQPPGLALLREYHDKKYASRYTSWEAAKAAHGELVISPLGTISKEKEDGTIKDRIIQDLRRGGATSWPTSLRGSYCPGPRTTVGTYTICGGSSQNARSPRTQLYGALSLTSKTPLCQSGHWRLSNGIQRHKWMTRTRPPGCSFTFGIPWGSVVRRSPWYMPGRRPSRQEPRRP